MAVYNARVVTVMIDYIVLHSFHTSLRVIWLGKDLVVQILSVERGGEQDCAVGIGSWHIRHIRSIIRIGVCCTYFGRGSAQAF